MRITISGASGFLGKELTRRLLAGGHELHLLGRAEPKELPSGVSFSRWNATAEEPSAESLQEADAVINLIGEPVFQRWTDEVKRRIRDSRILSTRHLVQALSKISKRPAVLISASATGYYGTPGETAVTESSSAGKGFLAEVCRDWEHDAELAASLGIRVVRLRTGIVLGHGGALDTMLPIFKSGAGGRLGGGEQWMSWIHSQDWVELVRFALGREEVRGPLNMVAPSPVRNADFTKILADALHRPAVFPVPRFALKLTYGEVAEVLLESLRVVPEVSQRLGYEFAFPTLGPALADLLK